MNWQFIRAIAEKDLSEVAKNRIALTEAIALSVIFAVGLPLLITQIPVLTTEATSRLLIHCHPASLRGSGTGPGHSPPHNFPSSSSWGYLIAPLFLILPLVLSCMIAAEAFVGEKSAILSKPSSIHLQRMAGCW